MPGDDEGDLPHRSGEGGRKTGEVRELLGIDDIEPACEERPEKGSGVPGCRGDRPPSPGVEWGGRAHPVDLDSSLLDNCWPVPVLHPEVVHLMPPGSQAAPNFVDTPFHPADGIGVDAVVEEGYPHAPPRRAGCSR